MTEEGERSLGIISNEYDTTEGSSPEKQSRNKMSRGTVKLVKKTEINPETNQEVDLIHQGFDIAIIKRKNATKQECVSINTLNITKRSRPYTKF